MGDTRGKKITRRVMIGIPVTAGVGTLSFLFIGSFYSTNIWEAFWPLLIIFGVFVVIMLLVLLVLWAWNFEDW